MPYAHRISSFSGAIPKLDYRLLPEGAAFTVGEAFFRSGRIDPMIEPVQVASSVSSAIAKSIYRLFSGTTSYWLSWDSDVDVARSPIAGDTSFKISFTSDAFEPRTTNLALATSTAEPYPNAWYVLGVSPPITALTATPSGGTGTLESRAYVYTFVTPWGEESAPSPASTLASGYPNASWALTALAVPPANAGTVSAATYALGVVTVTLNTVYGLRANEQITLSGVAGMTDLNSTFRINSILTAANQIKVTLTTAQTYTSGGSWARTAPHNTTNATKRIYRTVLAADGSTDYYFVAEIAASATTYTDTVLSSAVGEPIATTGWAMPPADMQGMLELPNGITCGFSGNKLCFSVPYAPYAWPLQYQYTCSFPIVGTGAFGQSVVVGTMGNPYVASGIDPSSMSMNKTAHSWPCIAKRGITSFGGSVYFPTNLGLAAIGVNGEFLATKDLFAQYNWEKLNPSTFVAANYDNCYYARHSAEVEEVLIVNPETGIASMNIQPTDLWTDPSTGDLFGQYRGAIWNINPTSGPWRTASWSSKEYVFPKPINIGAVKINAEYLLTPQQLKAVLAWNAAIDASNTVLFNNKATVGLHGALNAVPVNAMAVNGSTMVSAYKPSVGIIGLSMWVDDVPYYTTTVYTEELIRLPGGIKYDEARFQITSNVPIQSIALAETAGGLRLV